MKYMGDIKHQRGWMSANYNSFHTCFCRILEWFCPHIFHFVESVFSGDRGPSPNTSASTERTLEAVWTLASWTDGMAWFGTKVKESRIVGAGNNGFPLNMFDCQRVSAEMATICNFFLLTGIFLAASTAGIHGQGECRTPQLPHKIKFFDGQPPKKTLNPLKTSDASIPILAGRKQICSILKLIVKFRPIQVKLVNPTHRHTEKNEKKLDFVGQKSKTQGLTADFVAQFFRQSEDHCTLFRSPGDRKSPMMDYFTYSIT